MRWIRYQIAKLLGEELNVEVQIMQVEWESLIADLQLGSINAVIVVTHEMNFAKNVSNKIIFMDNGYIVEQGNPQYIFQDCQNKRLREFLNLD